MQEPLTTDSMCVCGRQSTECAAKCVVLKAEVDVVLLSESCLDVAKGVRGSGLAVTCFLKRIAFPFV